MDTYPTNFQILTGDNAQKRATFSRFLLPFRWIATKATKAPDSSAPFFRRTSNQQTADWIHAASAGSNRARYFTPETAELLFERASWWILDNPVPGKSVVIIPSPAKDPETSPAIWKYLLVRSGLKNAQYHYEVAVRPPALILFEDSPCDRHEARMEDEAQNDVLHIGFIVLETFFTGASGSFEGADEVKVSPPVFEDVLRFNEIFRYWRCPFEKHATTCAKEELESIAESWRGDLPKPTKPADSSDKTGNTATPSLRELDDLYGSHWMPLLSHPLQDRDGKQFSINPEKWPEEFKSRMVREKSVPLNANGDPHWLANPDDRAFTISSVFANGDLSVPRNGDQPQEEMMSASSAIADAYQTEMATVPAHAGYWMAQLNVDRPYQLGGAGPCSLFEYRWACERTYRRWLHYGALYGFTSHSMALLAGDVYNLKNDGPQGEPPLGLHMAGLYSDVSLLLLYMRVTLFRFSRELHEMSCLVKDQPKGMEKKKWRDNFMKLRWQFLLFENLYQFPLLSNQQQHIEIYALQRQWMDIKELYEEIDKEIQSSDEVFGNIVDEQRSSLAHRLNWIAAVGLVAGIFLAGFQIFFGAEKIPQWNNAPQLTAIIAVGFSCFCMVLVFAIPRIARSRKNKP